MNAARVPLSTCVLVFAMLSFLAARSAGAEEPYKLRPDFLWFISGHGVNVSRIADGGDSPFATTKLVSVADVPPAAAARAKIGEIRDALARLQTPGEAPGAVTATIPANEVRAVRASLLSKLGGGLDAHEIDLVVGIDLTTGVERTLLRAARSGSLLDPATADTIAAAFLPLYSIEPDHVRIHFKSDSQRRPPIDRTALAPFGTRKGDAFEPYDGMEIMPIASLIRAIPTP